MDKIVSQVGKKNNCTFCGVFRRQALDRGAAQLGVDHIVTGHNADDIAETVLMNSKLFPARATRIKLIDSNERGHSEIGALYSRHDPGGGYDKTVQTIQIRLRKGDCHVCVFQEIDILLDGMYIFSGR